MGSVSAPTTTILPRGPSPSPCQPMPTRGPFFPSAHAGTGIIDHSGDFVTWGTRICQARPQAVFHIVVAKTDSTGQHTRCARGRDLAEVFRVLEPRNPR